MDKKFIIQGIKKLRSLHRELDEVTEKYGVYGGASTQMDHEYFLEVFGSDFKIEKSPYDNKYPYILVSSLERQRVISLLTSDEYFELKDQGVFDGKEVIEK